MAITKTLKQYVDLDLSFKVNPFTRDLYLKTALKHLLRTRNFERPFHPEIGTQIQSLMFENFTSAVKIAMERTIRESIEKFEPRVRLIELVVDEAEDSNELVVNIIFALKNTNNPITITTFISRVR